MSVLDSPPWELDIFLQHIPFKCALKARVQNIKEGPTTLASSLGPILAGNQEHLQSTNATMQRTFGCDAYFAVHGEVLVMAKLLLPLMSYHYF